MLIKGSKHHSAASAASISLGNKGNKVRSGGNNHNNIVNSNYQNYFNSDDLSDVNLPDEQILINKLLKFYDPAARPVFNASQPVIIKFSFALIQICDMVFMMIFLRNNLTDIFNHQIKQDERNQILTTKIDSLLFRHLLFFSHPKIFILAIKQLIWNRIFMLVHLYIQNIFILNLFYQLFYFIWGYNLLVIEYFEV